MNNNTNQLARRKPLRSVGPTLQSSTTKGSQTSINPRLVLLAMLATIIAIGFYVRSELNRSHEARILADSRYKQLAQTHLRVLDSRISDFELDPKVARVRSTEAEQFASDEGLLEGSELEARFKNTQGQQRSTPAGLSMRIISHSATDSFKHIDLAVTTASGSFAGGLCREDFEVFVGDQRISAIAINKSHVSTETHAIAILRDKSASTKGAADIAAGEAIKNFINSLANPSRIRLWIFSDTVTAISPWTIDRELLTSLMVRQEPNGGTALYKSILAAINDLAARKERRSIVVFTDGKDSFNQDSIETLIGSANRHSVRIIVVALKTPELQEAILKRLAAETKGQYVLAEQPQTLIADFKTLALSFQQPIYRIVALHGQRAAAPVRITLGDTEVTIAN